MSTWTTYARKPEGAIPEPSSLELQPGGPPTKKPAWFRPPTRLSVNMDKVYKFLQANLGKRFSVEELSGLLSMARKSVMAACKALCLRGMASRNDEKAVVDKKYVTVIYVQGADPMGKLRKGVW